jgi:hypothetical protein
MSVVFSLPSGMRLVRVEPGDVNVPLQLVVKTVSRSAHCPVCQRVSCTVHSHYWRTLADLPANGIVVTLLLFQSPVPSPHLRGAALSFGQAAGSRPGVRLAIGLTIPTSATTLLRLNRA